MTRFFHSWEYYVINGKDKKILEETSKYTYDIMELCIMIPFDIL